MIGDWVWYDNQPHQIRQLGVFGENRDGDSYPAVCVGKPNGIGFMLERNEIDPIPLTPEILEKNGFVVESGFCYGNPLKYCVLVDGLWIYISGENYFEGNLEYVHQLQHAIRLCGIEKKIIL